MYNVVGIQKINYVSKKTGAPVVGTRLHCMKSFPDGSTDCEGYSVDSFYCSSIIDLTHVVVGCDIEVYFNRYGSVEFVRVVS